MVLGRRDESRDGTTGCGVRVETHEARLEDNRYLNMDLLAEQRRERQPDEALPHTKKEFAQLDGHNLQTKRAEAAHWVETRNKP